MAIKSDSNVIRRCPGNPLISIEDIPFQCSDICNAGVVRFEGRTLLLITIESLEGRCSLYLAHSDDGEHFHVEDRAFMASAAAERCAYEALGIRDPRITPLDGTYYIAYVAEGDCGMRIGLAKTDDFRNVQRLGFVSQPDSKNGVLFPVKFAGRYALLDRPSPGNSIWLSFSDDLTFWGRPRVVMTPRGRFWDSHRVGAAGPPIEMETGWLLIYYGEKITSSGPLVRLGAAILDKDRPWKVIGRSNIPILSPREMYERIGDVGNVTFSCGALYDDDGNVRVYYGASDSCICLGAAPLEDIVSVCMDGREEPSE